MLYGFNAAPVELIVVLKVFAVPIGVMIPVKGSILDNCTLVGFRIRYKPYMVLSICALSCTLSNTTMIKRNFFIRTNLLCTNLSIKQIAIQVVQICRNNGVLRCVISSSHKLNFFSYLIKSVLETETLSNCKHNITIHNTLLIRNELHKVLLKLKKHRISNFV